MAYERDGEDRLSQYLMDLIGLGTGGTAAPPGRYRDESLLFYTGLLALQPRSAWRCDSILEDYFDVPAEVEQFVGAWHPLDPADQCASIRRIAFRSSSAWARWWATRSGTSSPAFGSSWGR